MRTHFSRSEKSHILQVGCNFNPNGEIEIIHYEVFSSFGDDFGHRF